jgi:DnaJ-class molecular chaperone
MKFRTESRGRQYFGNANFSESFRNIWSDECVLRLYVKCPYCGGKGSVIQSYGPSLDCTTCWGDCRFLRERWPEPHTERTWP